jgi:peptide/nickel transport system ATP-binding protein
MYAGRIVEEGPAAQVFDHAVHPYSAALAHAFPRIGDPRFRYSPSGLPGDPPFPSDIPSGCAFHPRCPVAAESCSSTDVTLWPAGPDRVAACVRAPGAPAEVRLDPATEATA